jgi:hypothetical protein
MGIVISVGIRLGRGLRGRETFVFDSGNLARLMISYGFGDASNQFHSSGFSQSPSCTGW